MVGGALEKADERFALIRDYRLFHLWERGIFRANSRLPAL